MALYRRLDISSLCDSIFVDCMSHLVAADMARLAAASTRAQASTTAAALMVMRSRHNRADKDGGAPLTQLHALDETPTRFQADLRKRGARQVLCGATFEDIEVGGQPWLRCLAQYPPAAGDAWTMEMNLQRGMYRVTLSGWCNPSHGILDLCLNDKSQETHIIS